MRISDWSSDVCSSDLRRHNKGIGEADRSTDRGKRGAASTEALHVWAKLFRNCRRRGSGWGLAVLPATDLFPKNYEALPNRWARARSRHDTPFLQNRWRNLRRMTGR